MQALLSYNNLAHAVSGAVGSSFSLSVFYPLDLIRTRLQIKENLKSKYSWEAAFEIVKEDGIKGLYRGWYPVISTLFCSNFVYFYTYQGLKSLTSIHQESHMLKDLIIAYLAGSVNVVLTTPMWVVNTRLKLQGVKPVEKKDNNVVMYKGIIDCFKRIIREEGVTTLWNGVWPSLVLASNPAIQWMVYEAIKRTLRVKLGIIELSGLTYFIAGAIAKMIATIVTYPLQVLQTQLRAHGADKNNISSAYKNFREAKILDLFKGLEAKLTQTVLAAALTMLTYEKIVLFVFRLMGEKYKKL